MINITHLIARLKAGDEKAIKKVYEDNKNGFLIFANRYGLDKDELTDVYQDAVIALLENAKKGKIDDLKSSLTTYLFGIGKFMIFQRLKKNNKTIPSDDIENLEFEYEDYSEDEINLQIVALREGLKKLGEQCQKVLTLFYYEEKKLDEIQTLLGYTNKDVLKSQKSRCLKQLKDFTKK